MSLEAICIEIAEVRKRLEAVEAFEATEKPYRQFVAAVAEHLTHVFTVEGYSRGTGKEARAVLRAIREDMRTLATAVREAKV